MKYTTLIVVALLVTSTLTASGCDSKKCITCAAAGNDSSCLTCHKSKPTLPSGVTTYMNCSGAATAGCLVESISGCEQCDVASHYKEFGKKTCAAYDTASPATKVTKPSTSGSAEHCVSAVGGETGDSKGLCESCKGAFRPVLLAAPATKEPSCAAITDAVVGCAAHKAEKKCAYCSVTGGSVTDGTPADTCVAWTTTNKGCLDSGACEKCNHYVGYYQVSVKEPKCSMSSAILSVAGMIVALFLANF